MFIIRNVNIIDGTGAPARVGDVGMENGRFVLSPREKPGDTAIDGAWLTLVPGFIDSHSHGDLLCESDFSALSKLSQGITTQIAGQCGISMFPMDARDGQSHEKFIKSIALYPTIPERAICDYGEYARYLDGCGMRLNMATLVGHGALRLWAMGNGERKPARDEMRRMKELLSDALDKGACGMSTGLVYAPCCYAEADELIELLSVVHEHGGFYATHIRNEADYTIEAIEEAIATAKAADVPLWVSHFKAAGRKNWGKPRKMLKMLDEAAADGLRVTVDTYPYLAGMTSLNVSIPPRFRAKGLPALTEYLNDPVALAEMREEIARPSDYENYIINSGGFAGVTVSSCPVYKEAEGMTVAEFARARGMDEFDAYLDILRRNGGLGLAVYSHMSDDDLIDIASYKSTVFGTDALLGREGENGHPRAFGSAARAISHYVRERGIFTTEEAVRRMTGLPAERLGLPGKGVIRDGADADAVLLDMSAFRDTADYKHSNTLCEGVRAVYVAGEMAYDGVAKELTSARAGRFVRPLRG